MISVPSGSFNMGSKKGFDIEKPVHTVTLSAFEMSETEITQAQYEAVIGINPSLAKENPQLPVERVSWYNAVLFCNKLSEVAGYENCYDEKTWECDLSKNGFRLPTEAEWEYACRAGTTTKYYSGNTIDDLIRVGWFTQNSEGKTHPVGQKLPNAWGLYDMHGNVWEWTYDWLGDYSRENVFNPTGAKTGKYRVIRGGGFPPWTPNNMGCESGIRGYGIPDKSTGAVGFRVVRRSSAHN
ncbi:formylglycine-generating enzyme family protein [Candidatus Latescibacterota bacterium]